MDQNLLDYAALLVQQSKKLAAQEDCSVELAFNAIKLSVVLENDTDEEGQSIIAVLNEIDRNLSGIDYEIKNGLDSIAHQIQTNVGWIGEEISKR